MAFDTVIDKAQLESAMTATANAIREKTGDSGKIAWDGSKGFADAVSGIEAGGSGELVLPPNSALYYFGTAENVLNTFNFTSKAVGSLS